MTLPSPLNTLLPNALDVLRYFQTSGQITATIDDICQDVGLSERGFGKAIRSLVTRGYVIMDGNQVYRLTEKGSEALETLADYDFDEAGDEEDADSEDQRLSRRLLLALPQPLKAGEAARVIVGFEPLPEQEASAEIVVRLSVVNGEPGTPEEISFELDSDPATHDFLVTPGLYSQVRIRLEIFQMGPNPDDIAVAGGMYVDVDVVADGSGGALTAYGTDIVIEDRA